MKNICCNMCGVKRNLLLQAKVRIQSEPVEVSYKWMCFFCFLKMFQFFDRFEYKVDRKLIMESSEQALTEANV